MFSVIATLAMGLGIDCSSAFARLVHQVNPSQSDRYLRLLDELGEAACKTKNPDIIWKIAHAETRFKFDIIRVNKPGVDEVVEGQKVFSELGKLKAKDRRNIDLGVMQINWIYHGKAFGFDPVRMINPKNQVEYISKTLAPELLKVCGSKRWVECYHNRRSQERMNAYRRAIELASAKLWKAVRHVLSEQKKAEKKEVWSDDFLEPSEGGGRSHWVKPPRKL